MPLEGGEELTRRAHNQISGRGEDLYASRQDFLDIFHEDLNGLYQLSFLLTGDHQKGERCFVSGIEDCAKQSSVFRGWARGWAKRVIAEQAIREMHPRRKDSNPASVPTGFYNNQRSRRSIGHFEVDSILGLADFERFVFVLCVLEHYRGHDCALLLGCPVSEVRQARTRAIAELAGIAQAEAVLTKTVSSVVA
jgi:DNA-directed RNA polymerase specialized sigma24 family protein